MSETQILKLRGGNFYFDVPVHVKGKRLFLELPTPWSHPAAKLLCDEIKSMENRKWHPDEKMWSIDVSKRNAIALQYLRKDAPNPFARYEGEIQHFEPTRDALWQHQQDILDFILSRHYCIIAGEQGVGKTLPIIEAVELSGVQPENCWYVGPKSAITSVRHEFIHRWGARTIPSEFLTYEGLKARVNNWKPEYFLPQFIIGDESSRVKTHGTERTTAFNWIAEAIREEWGDDGYVVLASGTPAPKNPVDWWSQVEICCPGFLKESHPRVLQNTLAFVTFDENAAGQPYAKVKKWKDNEALCINCGCTLEFHLPDRQCIDVTTRKGKPLYYQPSVNEIARLYKRLKPIVIVKRKEDCLELPDKHYKMIECAPSDSVIRHAEDVVETTPSVAQAMIILREISDGFLYLDHPTDEIITCKRCKGTGKVAHTPDGADLEVTDWFEDDETEEDDGYTEFNAIEFGVTEDLEEQECPICGGEGKTNKVIRRPSTLECPKYDALADLLELHENDPGRIVIFAAFHASIDRIREFCLSKRWTVFQVDGRAWKAYSPSGDQYTKDEMYQLFQDKDRKIDNIVWLGHPRSSGMGLTLTESPTIVFFSNSFNGEDRMQAEDRIHRPGMDVNKGATIIDLVHLPIEKEVVENLRNKVSLQNMTLGVIKDSFQNITVEKYGR